jgi:hypothetical protein
MYGLYKIIASLKTGRVTSARKDRFLNYEPDELLGIYVDERPIAPSLPYTEVGNLLWQGPSHTPRVEFVESPGSFELSAGSVAWREASARGFDSLVASGRVKNDELAVRLAEARVDNGTLRLKVQRARYHDQARSNLVLDFDRENPGHFVSLRQLLIADYGKKLPDLHDGRLANTLGIAALVYYPSGNAWVPYLVRRVRKIGVFPGGLHCTASGVAKWPPPEAPRSLDGFATEHMYYELEEEVGIQREDLIDLRPVALCREMARGGKPQLFYVGFTKLCRTDLAKRRLMANRSGEWPEVERDRWYRSADFVADQASLLGAIKEHGVTLETRAAVLYGEAVCHAFRGIGFNARGS